MVRKVRVKESVAIVEESPEVYRFVFTHARRIKRMQVNGLIRLLLEKCSQEKGYDYIVNSISQYDSNEVSEAIRALEMEGILRVKDDSLSPRIEKQVQFIDEFTKSWEETLERQGRITNSKIGVFGVGGVGSWIVNGLHQMGVGEIRIVDPDKVEESNLNRQFFYAEDVGNYKVDVLANRLKNLKIVPYKREVSRNENLEDIVTGLNFIVNCADQPSVVETSQIINEYAVRHNIPYCVAGGYNLHIGMVGPIIVPGKTKEFQDFIEHQKKNDPLKGYRKIKDVEESGNLSPIAGAVANIQIMQIFKYLTGIGEVRENRFAEINFLNLEMDWIEY